MKQPAPPKAPVAESADHILRRLDWTVVRRLDGLLQGDYRTFLRGAGMELADLREYQLHDDVRHIDWNVTARMQVPHVRVFTEDREMSAWFLLDLSPSVDFGSNLRKKRTVSSEFVGTLAHMLTRHGNKIGAVFYGGGIDTVIPAKSGRMQVLQIEAVPLYIDRLRTSALRGTNPDKAGIFDAHLLLLDDAEIGRASCRERVSDTV